MTLLDLAIPVIGALAFVGYVTCLLRFVWLTGVGTLGFAAVAYLLHPIGSGTHVYWGMAGAGLILALEARGFSGPLTLLLRHLKSRQTAARSSLTAPMSFIGTAMARRW